MKGNNMAEAKGGISMARTTTIGSMARIGPSRSSLMRETAPFRTSSSFVKEGPARGFGSFQRIGPKEGFVKPSSVIRSIENKPKIRTIGGIPTVSFKPSPPEIGAKPKLAEMKPIWSQPKEKPKITSLQISPSRQVEKPKAQTIPLRPDEIVVLKPKQKEVVKPKTITIDLPQSAFRLSEPKSRSELKTMGKLVFPKHNADVRNRIEKAFKKAKLTVKRKPFIIPTEKIAQKINLERNRLTSSQNTLHRNRTAVEQVLQQVNRKLSQPTLSTIENTIKRFPKISPAVSSEITNQPDRTENPSAIVEIIPEKAGIKIDFAQLPDAIKKELAQARAVLRLASLVDLQTGIKPEIKKSVAKHLTKVAENASHKTPENTELSKLKTVLNAAEIRLVTDEEAQKAREEITNDSIDKAEQIAKEKGTETINGANLDLPDSRKVQILKSKIVRFNKDRSDGSWIRYTQRLQEIKTKNNEEFRKKAELLRKEFPPVYWAYSNANPATYEQLEVVLSEGRIAA